MAKNSVHKKLANILSEELNVSKSGWNNFHKYKYVTEADVVEAVRKVFNKHGLIYTFDMLDVQQINPELCRSKIKFSLVDADTGDTVDSVVYGDGQDKGDKGTYKSITGAQKYFLLKTLLISTGDDPEADEGGMAPSKQDTASPQVVEAEKPKRSFRKIVATSAVTPSLITASAAIISDREEKVPTGEIEY
jgi:hypothetical protein